MSSEDYSIILKNVDLQARSRKSIKKVIWSKKL
jgi:hypothetical protein